MTPHLCHLENLFWTTLEPKGQLIETWLEIPGRLVDKNNENLSNAEPKMAAMATILKV